MSQLKHFSHSDIEQMDRRYRANLINCLTGYKPALLIGTFSENGVANLGLFSSVCHVGANPPLIGFIQRPVGEFSHTYKNIIRDKFFTINHVHESFVEKAHLTSAKYDVETSEFSACGLTKEELEDFRAPFVKESKIKLGMKFVQEIPIELNKTIFMIAEIKNIFLPKKVILQDGNLDLPIVNDVCSTGLYTYNKVSPMAKYQYAKKYST